MSSSSKIAHKRQLPSIAQIMAIGTLLPLFLFSILCGAYALVLVPFMLLADEVKRRVLPHLPPLPPLLPQLDDEASATLHARVLLLLTLLITALLYYSL